MGVDFLIMVLLFFNLKFSFSQKALKTRNIPIRQMLKLYCVIFKNIIPKIVNIIPALTLVKIINLWQFLPFFSHIASINLPPSKGINGKRLKIPRDKLASDIKKKASL